MSVVLLDIDGTLIDSNDAHARAWVDAASELGYELSFRIVRSLIGMGGDKLMPVAFGVEHDSDEGERLAKRRGEVFRERHLPAIRPFPGTRELLLRMRADGHRLVVATSAQEDEMAGLLRAANVADLIEDAASSDDAERSKPDPDIVKAALAKAGSAPTDAIMLGDTPYDVEAAGRAGVAIVALECGGWRTEELRGAIAIYADPAALLRAYEASPFAERAATAKTSR